MRVLVTGSEGYVGGVLCDYLAKQGIFVKGYDAGFFRGTSLIPASRDSVWPTSREPRLEKKDIRDIVESDLKGIDAIVHLAALSNDPAGDLNPDLTYRINQKESIRLASLAKQAGVKKFILASSCAVYGLQKGKPATEESEVNPLTAYARAKVNAERDISLLTDENFSPTSLRSATVCGVSPRMRFDLVLNNMVAWAHLYNKIKVDSAVHRPLVHVNDLARAYYHLLILPSYITAGQKYNLAQSNVRLSDLANQVSEAFNNCPIEKSNGAVDKRDYRVSAEKLAKTGFKYEWSIPRAIENLKQTFNSIALAEPTYKNEFFWTVKRLKNLMDGDRIDENFRWNLDKPGLGIDGHMKSWVSV